MGKYSKHSKNDKCRKKSKKCQTNYEYIRSLFPKDCRKYVDGIKHNSDKLYCCMKKNLTKNCDKSKCDKKSSSCTCSFD